MQACGRRGLQRLYLTGMHLAVAGGIGSRGQQWGPGRSLAGRLGGCGVAGRTDTHAVSMAGALLLEAVTPCQARAQRAPTAASKRHGSVAAAALSSAGSGAYGWRGWRR